MEEENLTSLSPSSSSQTPSSPLINRPSNSKRPFDSIISSVGESEPTTPTRNVRSMINAHHYPSPSRTITSDRFIPLRTSSNFALFSPGSSPIASSSSSKPDGALGGASSAYPDLLRAALFGPDAGYSFPGTPDRGPVNRNIFRFNTQTKLPLPSLMPFGPDDALPSTFYSAIKTPRKLSKTPYKTLDAPELQDDFYLNLVDWSSNNVLAAGLGNCVYLWNAYTSEVDMLCDLGTRDSVCSVGWDQKGINLAVGTNNGEVQIWDVSQCKLVRNMEGHRLRVGALAWSSSMLSSGSRDKNIFQRDIRAQDNYVSKLTGHKSEVCGLKWSFNNRELASGGNDNNLFVWNQHSTQHVLKYSEHTSAIKAIAWSPHHYGLLASGGGTADQCIRFRNTTTNSQLKCMETGSQVCNLVWSKTVNELVSTHGFSQNQIIVWKYPSMSKLATLTGHTYRVLYLAISPDGQNIVTGAGDESLRFWNVFPSAKSKINDGMPNIFSHERAHIR